MCADSRCVCMCVYLNLRCCVLMTVMPSCLFALSLFFSVLCMCHLLNTTLPFSSKRTHGLKWWQGAVLCMAECTLRPAAHYRACCARGVCQAESRGHQTPCAGRRLLCIRRGAHIYYVCGVSVLSFRSHTPPLVSGLVCLTLCTGAGVAWWQEGARALFRPRAGLLSYQASRLRWHLAFSLSSVCCDSHLMLSSLVFCFSSVLPGGHTVPSCVVDVFITCIFTLPTLTRIYFYLLMVEA